VTDDIERNGEFAESPAVWWAGIAVASVVTFVVVGGVLAAGTYALNSAELVDLSYWVPGMAAVVLTGVLVAVAVRRGDIKYEPR